MDHLHDSFSLHRRGTLEDAKNWKTGSAAHDSTLLLATRIPSARVQPRLSFGRGTTHWCSTGPRSYSVSGSNAPLLKRPLCRCGSIVRPFHPCWSAPTAPVDYSFRNELRRWRSTLACTFTTAPRPDFGSGPGCKQRVRRGCSPP